MELEARSPVVATKSLSQAQAARLVAAECYRHKLDHMVLTTHCTILWRMSAAMITYFNGNAQPNNFEARDLAAHDPMDQPPWVLQRLPPCVVQFDQRRDFYNLTSDGMSPRDYSTAFTVSVPADDGSSPCLASQISRIANYEIRDMFRNAQSRDSLARRGLCQRAGGWEQSVDPAWRLRRFPGSRNGAAA